MAFTWQNGRQLASVSQNGTTVATYTYDADGLRTSKTVGENVTEYYWMNGMLYGQKTGDEYIFFLYDENGNVYGFVVKNSNSQSYYYYEFNLQGDIIGIIDSSGMRVVEYTYGAWGDILSITGTMADTIGQKNPLRYRGYYYDAETGFYYLQSRYYDAEICRFLNADGYVSTGQNINGFNMFAYCENNPINCSDPSGFFSFWDLTDIVFAGKSWAEYISEPSWTRFGSAVVDTVCLLPIIPSIGGIKQGVNILDDSLDVAKVADTVVDTTKAAKKGWQVGDDIANLTKAGNKPAWSTVKSRFWKNEAALRPELYSPENIQLMKKGLAPLVEYDGKFYSMEIHHIIPQRNGGSNTYKNLLPLAPWDHAAIDPYRYFKP